MRRLDGAEPAGILDPRQPAWGHPALQRLTGAYHWLCFKLVTIHRLAIDGRPKHSRSKTRVWAYTSRYIWAPRLPASCDLILGSFLVL